VNGNNCLALLQATHLTTWSAAAADTDVTDDVLASSRVAGVMS